MKLLLVFATACLLGAASAQAQTVLPSGAVAPAGAITPTGTVITPATVPGSQPVVTPGMRDGGSRRASRRDDEAPGMNRQDKKRLRKMGKMKYSSDASKPSGKK